MGKIRITGKVTVTRKINYSASRRVTYKPQQIYYPSPSQQINTAPIQKALNDLEHDMKRSQRQLTSRRRSIPTGTYSKPVEAASG